MTRHRIRSQFLPLVVVGAALLSLPAHGAEPSSDDGSSAARIAELNEAGARFYSARSYRQAIEKFIEAYSIDHDPNLLFNIARCYEELGETAAAIEKYEAFIAAPGADADGRLRAEESLRALRGLEAAGTSADKETRPSEAAGTAEDGAGTESSTAGFLPWAALGGGIVVTGLGATFYALGASDHAEVTSAPGYGDPSTVHPMTEREATALVESGNTKKVVGAIGLGLGGALIATSVVLFVTGGKSAPARDATALRVTVDPGPRRLAVGLTGSF